LYGPEGGDVAGDPEVLRQVLAGGIPALTNAAGGPSGADVPMDSFDLMGFKSDGWPERREGEWRHSDMKNIAFLFNHELFDELISKGGLR